MKSLFTLGGGGPGKAERGCWRSQTSMADSSTSTWPILDPSLGRRYARRQLHAGIRYVPVASIPMKLISTLGKGVMGTVSADAGDPRGRWPISPHPLDRL